jgi:TIR domain
MSTSFFSYSRADKYFAMKLAEDLRRNEIDIWFDQIDIPKGSLWDIEIEKALKNCDTLIVVISSNSIKSNNVLDEISFAIEEGKKIIPVKISKCDIPFRIRRLQYIEFENNYSNGLEALIKTYRKEPIVLPSPSKKPKINRNWLIVLALMLVSTLFFIIPKLSNYNKETNPSKTDTTTVIIDKIGTGNFVPNVKKDSQNINIDYPKTQPLIKIKENSTKPISATSKIYDYHTYWDANKENADLNILNYRNSNGGIPDANNVIRDALKKKDIIKVDNRYNETYSCSVSFEFFWIVNEDGSVSNITHSTENKNCTKVEINKLIPIITEIISSFRYKPIKLKDRLIKYRDSEILIFYD